MKKVFMVCATALAVFVASCSYSSSRTSCYECTTSSMSDVTGVICNNKLTYSGLPAGDTLPNYPGTTNDQIKTAMEAAGFNCVETKHYKFEGSLNK